LCWHRLSALMSKGWAPWKRDLLLYTLANRLQNQKAKLNLYMAACDSIGYFIDPSAMCPSSCFNSLSFICLLCHSFPLPHYQNTACLFLFWSSSLLQYLSPKPPCPFQAKPLYLFLYLQFWAKECVGMPERINCILNIILSCLLLMVRNNYFWHVGNCSFCLLLAWHKDPQSAWASNIDWKLWVSTGSQEHLNLQKAE
jgi:hypothetical protein